MTTETATAADKPKAEPPKDIAPKMRAYAFERSLGIPPCEACRRAGGNDRHGHATKWERSRGVQAWIKWYRSGDCTEDMLFAKRQRLEQRLELAAYGNILDFAEIKPTSPIEWDERVNAWTAYYRALGYQDDVETIAAKRAMLEQALEQSPQIDWSKVAESPYGAIIESFKFDKDTGRLTDFGRDSALAAIAQLRDMHGFKAPTKTALTDPTGNNPASLYLISDKPMSEAEWEQQRAGVE
jgi:hypothetical protein